MTPTQLYPTDLIAVPVPVDATNIERVGLHLFYYTDEKRFTIHQQQIGSRFRLLGTCSKSDIDFDVEPFTDITIKQPQGLTMGRLCNHLRMAKKEHEKYFRSLLTANGLHFDNNDNLVEKLVILKRV